MPPAQQREESAANPAFLDAFADVSEAVESGAGLPEVARAVSRALDASVAVVDASANVLAVACASPDDERAVLSQGEVLELRVADTDAGQLRYRVRGESPQPALLRLLGTLIAQEVERAKATAKARELDASMSGFLTAVARSRPASDPVDIHRAGAEAFLAANVAVAQGEPELAFEETGAYRLLLPAMVEDPEELRRFHEETVAPLVVYDEQYETELVRTLETFLEADGNVAQTAQRLYTHRHTVRYRLERVKELTGLDVGSTDGRERLGLGLKAMRVLGILAPHGPATEPGAEAGRVPREEKDR